MHTSIHQETPPFRLCLAVLNFDMLSPVLFLHVLVDRKNKAISGTCEFSALNSSKYKSFHTEVSGEYRHIKMLQEGERLVVNLLGFASYDHVSPVLKITMIIRPDWQQGEAHYQFMKDGEWVHIHKSELKIKSAQPDYALIAKPDITMATYLSQKKA